MRNSLPVAPVQRFVRRRRRQKYALYATVANDSCTFAHGESCARYHRVMFRQRIVHEFGLSFDGFANVNVVGASHEYDAKISFTNFVTDDDRLTLVWVADD